jgi:hypothetical protein
LSHHPPHRPQRKRSLDGAPVDEPPEVIALETLAVIDHSCKVPDHFFKAGPFKGELGGSIRVDDDELQTMLVNVGEFSTKAGGSAANTARGLAAGFDIRTSLISAVGKDEWGALFTSSMHRAGVDTSGTIVREGNFIFISIWALDYFHMGNLTDGVFSFQTPTLEPADASAWSINTANEPCAHPSTINTACYHPRSPRRSSPALNGSWSTGTVTTLTVFLKPLATRLQSPAPKSRCTWRRSRLFASSERR